MGRTEDLSDFQRGTIIGCHLSKKSVHEISALLKMPQSTVSSVIVKWKRLGAPPRGGRPQKLANRDIKVLERAASGNGLSTVTEVQTSSERNISPRTVHQELHTLAAKRAANKPKAIKHIKPVLKPDNKETSDTKENTGSSNEG